MDGWKASLQVIEKGRSAKSEVVWDSVDKNPSQLVGKTSITYATKVEVSFFVLVTTESSNKRFADKLVKDCQVYLSD